jgi:hypothetical protein
MWQLLPVVVVPQKLLPGWAALFGAALFLSGCGMFERKVEYVPYEVEVEVPVGCKVEQPAKPIFAGELLRKDDDLDRKVKVLLAERQQHLGYEEKLETALASCR